jgi:predicted lysophospholipase L1 biosynthesis ABC-type transport system permease subunit
VITNGLFNRIDPTTVPQDVLLKLAPGTDLAAAVAELRPEFGGIIGLARPQADVRNLDRVKPQLRVVAPVVILFAIAALTHALITTVRVRRRDLATMRALGFTGGQVAASIGWHAAFVQAVALIVGVPVGLIAARSGWRSVEARLGVIPDSSVPWPTVVLALAGALLICATAALTGRLVGVPNTADALHSE